jgi:TetR/AcrR family transcriptional regulator, regulator of cefoperazone and chloramphenicol sensitivity
MALPASSDLTAYARIRNAALAGFARDGIRATSIREVAKTAGVSPGLVQHHFPTKRALRDAVNDHVVAIVSAPFQDLPRDPAQSDPFEELGNRVTALVSAHPDALLYAARAIVEEDEGALSLFDAFVGLAEAQWGTLADAGLLRPDVDVRWVALHAVIFNLGTLLFRAAVERHLPQPFMASEQLQRWNVATTSLLRHGTYSNDPRRRHGSR